MTAVRDRARSALHAGPRRIDRRRATALLAAFSVLGVGAGVTTLASWQQVLGVGTGSTPIGTSSFCVEESVNGTSFVQGVVNQANTALTFTPTNALALSPGDALFAYVQFRTCSSSTRAGSLTLAGVTGAGTTLAPYLTYGMVAGVASSASCTASAFTAPSASNVLAPVTTALNATGAPSTTAITLPVGASGAAGSPVGVCIEVALPQGTGAGQGQTASPTWTFNAQSS